MRFTGRSLRSTMIIVATSVGLIVAGAVPAHAGVSVTTDSLEGNPAATWRVEHYGNSNGGFDINAGLARSFNNNAWLSASDNFSAVGREFTMPTRGISCGATIWVASFGVSNINVEVIDPRTWTGMWYSFTLSSSAYNRVTFPTWSTPRVVFLRVSLIGSA